MAANCAQNAILGLRAGQHGLLLKQSGLRFLVNPALPLGNMGPRRLLLAGHGAAGLHLFVESLL